MYQEASIRELLIDSCHSVPKAEEFFAKRLSDPELLATLMEITVDAGGHLGDARMQAAYFVSQFPASMLIRHEAALVDLLPRADGYGGHIAVALGKTRSPRGRQLLIQKLGDGSRFDAWLFKIALAEYTED